jgi:quinoprotein glucose dehydrogenase
MAWGGAAWDAAHRLLIVPVNELAAEVRLLPRAEVATAPESAGRSIGGPWEIGRQLGTPYAVARRFLLAPGGWPCTPPPWGELVAVDVDTAAVRWRVPLGRMPPLGPAAPPPAEYGAVSLGGPIVTAGGLVFQAGTVDARLRAFDVTTGKELWAGELPTSARATPMTFRGPDGKQYVVVAAGGHGLPVTPLGDALVAFSLGD